MKKALVSLSGGIDSATVVAEAINSGAEVTAYFFYYRSKHNSHEYDAFRKLIAHFDIEGGMIDVSHVMNGFRSSLLKGGGDLPQGHYENQSMKQTVVPARNLIFASILAGLAVSKGACEIWMGMHAGDRCLPALTPVWTQLGPVPIEEIEPGRHEVMSFDKDKKLIVWAKVLKRVRQGVPREVFKIVTQSGAVLDCTGMHQVYVVDRPSFRSNVGYEKVLTKKRAKNLSIGDCLITPGGVLETENDEVVSQTLDLLPMVGDLPRLYYDDEYIWFKQGNKARRHVSLEAFIRLIAWYVTEGYLASESGPRPNNYGIYIAQSTTANPERVDEILTTAREWGFNARVHGKGTNSTIYFSGPTAELLVACGRKSRHKKVPSWLLALPNRCLRLLLDTLIKGDGFVREGDKTKVQFITTSRHLISQVAYIGNRLGYKASVAKMMSVDCYAVSLSRPRIRPNTNRYGDGAYSPIVKIEKVANLAPVYDLEVEGTHNFFAGITVPLLVSNSIYPDCRIEFVRSLCETIVLATGEPIRLLTPFIHDIKRDIIAHGLTMKPPVPYEMTRTCYSDNAVACGRCGACQERLISFKEVGQEDPIMYTSREIMNKEKR